ncbi:hypothetical protein [Phenylobacterium koreense]|uniref:Tip attachment protein J domain-containing protein n=1 Tax=Phenylobacterium koreense TaxID=266125 RepID=A0ABV2EKN9_9CAUL
MILIELTAAIDSDGTEQKFYFATEGYQSGPTDSPPNVAFDNAIADPGYIGQSAFSDGKTEGASSLEVGEIVILNGDGDFDIWATYSFDGRPLRIRRGQGGAYPTDFEDVFAGTVASVTVTLDKVVVSIREKSAIMDVPVLTTTYAGTNVGPVGLEGTSDDLKGQVKPRVYGRVLNIAPRPANSSKRTFQVSDRAVAAIPKVYDRGVELTPGADYATSALMTAASLTPGSATFVTCLAEGLFRLSDDPDGIITADVDEKSTDEEMMVAPILQRMCGDLALTDADLDDQVFAELNADAPYVAGLWLSDQTTFREAFDMVAGSVGAWHGFDTAGVFQCEQLKEPAATPDFDIIEAEVMNGFEHGVADRDGVPVWRVTVRYRKHWETQTTDLAGSVSTERRAALAEEFRSVTAEDETVKHQFRQAGELVVDTYLTSAVDAQAVANRLLALHKVRRDLCEVPLNAEALDQDAMQVMSTGRLTHSRFGLSGGRNLRVLGRRLELGRDSIRLKMWG